MITERQAIDILQEKMLDGTPIRHYIFADNGNDKHQVIQAIAAAVVRTITRNGITTKNGVEKR